MFGITRINGINMLELYLNSRPRQRNSSSMDLTWVSSNSKRTTQTSQIIGPSKLGGKPSR